jgi:hypothetical protein
MSIETDTISNEPQADPRDDPEAFLRECFDGDGDREVLEALAELDLGPLSEDARQIVRILDAAPDQEESV